MSPFVIALFLEIASQGLSLSQLIDHNPQMMKQCAGVLPEAATNHSGTMTTLKSFALFSLVLLLLVTSTSAQTLFPRDVQLKLTLAEFKAAYKMGEPIRL